MGIAAAAPAGALGDDGLTPLDAMLATMRWAHAAAEAMRAQITARAGRHAIDAAKAVLALRDLAVKTAKAAAPYVHARMRPAEPRRPGEKTHEEWLADMERAAAESSNDQPAPWTRAADAPPREAAREHAAPHEGGPQDAGPQDAAPGGAVPRSGGTPRARATRPPAAAAPEPPPTAAERLAAQDAERLAKGLPVSGLDRLERRLRKRRPPGSPWGR